MALQATLTGALHVAKREVKDFMFQLFGINMGLGSTSNIEERVANSLAPVQQKIHDYIFSKKVTLNFDETGWRHKGMNHYAWVASCPDAVIYMIHPHRSRAALLELVKGPTDNYAAITDRFCVYQKQFAVHQYCLAHLIRDMKRYSERDGPDREVGENLHRLLKEVCHHHRAYRGEQIQKSQRYGRITYRKEGVRFWLEHGLANGSDKLSSLCDRLLDHFGNLWSSLLRKDHRFPK
jgi:hypothetical protein